MHGTLEIGGLEVNDTEGFIGPAAAWYALLIESGKERKACIWMRRRQYEPYWPRYMSPTKLNRHRFAERWRSVIPGYLFLPIGERGANWSLLETAPGFRSFLRSGSGDLIKIPEFGRQGIEQIREIESALNLSIIAAADGVPFKVGQQVMLSKLEIPAIVLRIDRKRKICVEAKLFGRVVRINVPAAEIEAI